jgi:hypothetical protein
MHLSHQILALHAWPSIDSVGFDPPPRTFDAILMSELHIASPLVRALARTPKPVADHSVGRCRRGRGAPAPPVVRPGKSHLGVPNARWVFIQVPSVQTILLGCGARSDVTPIPKVDAHRAFIAINNGSVRDGCRANEPRDAPEMNMWRASGPPRCPLESASDQSAGRDRAKRRTPSLNARGRSRLARCVAPASRTRRASTAAAAKAGAESLKMTSSSPLRISVGPG